MNTLRRLLVLAALGLMAAGPAQAADATQADVDKAIDTFKFKDPSMAARFGNAHGYAVFPRIGKAGFVVGGAGGSGRVYERGKFIGDTSVTQVTVGLQAGAQDFAQVIFFQNKGALDRFTSGKYELAAGMSAVVAKAGASGNTDYRDGVAVFSHPLEGAMVEASVGGQKFKFKAAAK